MPNKADSVKHRVGYFKNQRSEMLQYIPKGTMKLLEVGCGEGNFLSLLNNEQQELWGIELNSDAAAQAKSKFKNIFSGSFESNFENLPKDYFDCIVFNDVLEHMYSPWDVIAACKKLLNTNGVIVSSIPNFRYISNLITEIVLKGEFEYKPGGGILDDTHIRFFTSKSIKRMYAEQGYSILKHEGVHTCKSWKEKLCIFLSFGILKDSKYKQFATVAKPN